MPEKTRNLVRLEPSDTLDTKRPEQTLPIYPMQALSADCSRHTNRSGCDEDERLIPLQNANYDVQLRM